MVKAAIALALALSMVPLALQPMDGVPRPKPYVVASTGGDVYFKMVPDGENSGRGTAYLVSEEASDIPLWSVAGWYAFTTFISGDGRYLVRLGDWPMGMEPSDRDLAVAFYDHGKLVSQYSTKVLIKRPECVQPSASHYEYLRPAAPIGFIQASAQGNASIDAFRLVTIDDIEYTFALRDGSIANAVPYKN